MDSGQEDTRGFAGSPAEPARPARIKFYISSSQYY